jgi:asparagine synthase (glutamine-hydrolysing)
MCGILGFSHVSRRLPEGVLVSALASLVHRGPDQQGRFLSEHISLGATRLRILDMEGGDQPLHSPDGDVVLIFNGEIFNCKELRAELETGGIRFKTRCDSEVVLNAYLFWGNSCFRRMRGMFAIAIWKKSECRLTLVRDRMGIKPLYYYLHDNEILFGSELKCILAHPEVPRQIDVAGLQCFLSMNYVPGPMTLIEGIAKLVPGHILEWHRGAVTTTSFVEVPRLTHAPKTVEAACEELDHLLSRSVSEQLASDVPVGVWLSGGLDSSTILHYAAKASQRSIRTFSVTFRGRSFDEKRYIREVSNFFGTEHSEFDLSPDVDLSAAIEDIAYYSDEPGADAGALPLWFLARMTKKDVTVVLSGEGADELFGGYLTYQADRYRKLAARLPLFAKKAALACASKVPVSDDKIGFEYKLKRFLQGTRLSAEAAHVFWNGTFSEEEKRDIFRFSSPEPLTSILGTTKRTSRLERYLEFDQRFYLPDDILYKVDRMSMAHSLEARPPFLDPRIVDFAARLPDSMKIRAFKSKYVLRRLMKDKLPPNVLSRPKIGLDIPIHDWFRGPLRSFLLDTVSEESILRTGLFQWPAVSRMLDAHLKRKANVGYHLWGLMTLLIWMRRWKIQSSTPCNQLDQPLPRLVEEVR